MSDKVKAYIKEILGWTVAFGIAMLIATILLEYVIVNANIPSESMENTVMKGDRLIANRLAYKFSEPERKDIIVFNYPVDNKTLYIKRIIGLPNEKVDIYNGKIYINDSETPLEEDYLPEEWYKLNDGLEFLVPEDSYLVLGDNRNVSEDARYWYDCALEKGKSLEEAYQCQFVKKDQIKGKAIFRYWPITKFKMLQ